MFRASSAHLQEDIVVYKHHMVPSLSIRVLVACRYAASQFMMHGQNNIKLCRMVVSYRRFGTIYRSPLNENKRAFVRLIMCGLFSTKHNGMVSVKTADGSITRLPIFSVSPRTNWLHGTGCVCKKLTVLQLNKKSHILWHPKAYYCAHKNPSLVRLPSYLHPDMHSVGILRSVEWYWLYINYILITNLMHWLLFIHKILFSSTCFEHQVLIFRRT